MRGPPRVADLQILAGSARRSDRSVLTGCETRMRHDGGSSARHSAAARTATSIITTRRCCPPRMSTNRNPKRPVVRAYQRHCAGCRLRRDELLDAAHIVPDAEQRRLRPLQAAKEIVREHLCHRRRRALLSLLHSRRSPARAGGRCPSRAGAPWSRAPARS
jgi:hypothetical protein